MRVLLVFLVALLVALQLRLWWGQGGLAEVRRLERAISTQASENERLRARNLALEAEVEDLRSGLDAVEERARSELGMIRPGEVYYQVVEPVPPP